MLLDEHVLSHQVLQGRAGAGCVPLVDPSLLCWKLWKPPSLGDKHPTQQTRHPAALWGLQRCPTSSSNHSRRMQQERGIPGFSAGIHPKHPPQIHGNRGSDPTARMGAAKGQEGSSDRVFWVPFPTTAPGNFIYFKINKIYFFIYSPAALQPPSRKTTAAVPRAQITLAGFRTCDSIQDQSQVQLMAHNLIREIISGS